VVFTFLTSSRLIPPQVTPHPLANEKGWSESELRAGPVFTGEDFVETSSDFL
jgi:hypothetical protein